MAISGTNFKQVEITIKVWNRGESILKKVMGRKLAENWFVTALQKKEGGEHKRLKVLTHTSGLAAVAGIRFGNVIKLWKEIRELDIHYPTKERLKKSGDYQELAICCRSYRGR